VEAISSVVMPTSFTHTVRTPIPALVTFDEVVRALHDHERFVRLNPLVKACPPVDPARQPDAEGFVAYAVVDQLAYVPWDVKYTAWLADAPDGLQSKVAAPGGMDIEGVWRVVREGDVVVLEEVATVRCSPLVRWFVEKTIQDAHGQLHQRLLDQLLRERNVEAER
jgi:hypothetical protein